VNLYGIPITDVKAAVLEEASEREKGSLGNIKVCVFSWYRYM